MSFKQLENHSQLLCGRDSENETLALPIWRLELITNKVKQNYLKQRDLAPLIFVLSIPGVRGTEKPGAAHSLWTGNAKQIFRTIVELKFKHNWFY